MKSGALFTIIILAATSGRPGPEATTGSVLRDDQEPVGAPYEHFCKKNQLLEQDGRLYCNWGPSFGHACFPSVGILSIQKGAVISGPTVVGKCDDGDEVVKITHY